jgi:oligopeptide/dipeptide ABC transporter ATP-binding protein
LDAAVRDVSFAVRRGEIVGIVGESGSGKSLTALAAARMLDDPLVSSARQHIVLDQDVRGSRDDRRRREFLGTSLALVYQDPNATLNPALRLGGQITEVARLYGGLGRRAAQDRAMAELGRVALPPDRTILRRYQHELSGGMKQRVSIATGLMTQPRLLIADEPTTALDVTVQAQIIRLLGRIRDDQQTAIVLISHDIAVVTEICDRVLVMYAGHIVEEAAADRLALHPAHPYTRALLGSSLDIDTDIDRPLPVIPGRVPGPSDRTPGCRFAARCPRVIDRCRLEVPLLAPVAEGQSAACWNPETPVDRESDHQPVGASR